MTAMHFALAAVALNAWISEQPEPRPSRPEAMRVIVADWMTERGRL